MKFDIFNRFTGAVQFTAEIDCSEDAPRSIKIGLAVRWAVKNGADLRGAILIKAILIRAELRGADLSDAELRGADLSGAKLAPHIPVILDLDAKILALVEADDTALDMSDWHTCETTHCRAGWAITLAGEAGKRLEDQFGPAAAGALIYAASCPDLPIPDFYTSNEAAIADMRERGTKS